MKLLKPAAYLLLFAFGLGPTAMAQDQPQDPLVRIADNAPKPASWLPYSSPALLATAVSPELWPDAPSAQAPPAPPQEQAIQARKRDADLNARPTMNSPMGGPFWISNTLLMASTVTTIEMIMGCRASACQMVPDSLRNRGALYGIGIPASLGVSYISYKLKRGGTRWWIVPVAVFTAGNVIYAAHASQWGR